MKTCKIILTWLLSIAIVLASSCKGPEGPEGPIGPAGPTGAAGVAGPVGSANVIYSDWFSVTAFSSSWVSSTFGLRSAHYYDITAATSVTQTNIDKGLVLVYADLLFTGGQIVLLPFRDNYTSTIDNQFHFMMVPSKVTVWCVHYGTNVASPAYATRFRYVVIPGVVTGGRALPPVDYSDYNAVKAYYHIPD